MNIAIVDDEKYAANNLEKMLRDINPQSNIQSFGTASAVLKYLKQNRTDVAFLDIEMPDISGLLLAKIAKDIQPSINIIFVTGHSKYALEAHGLYVSGFLLKPVSAIMLTDALAHLRVPPKNTEPRIRVQTFGNFDIFVDGEILVFPRAKSKELLAYLVDRRGGSATMAEIAAVLWEDKPCSRSVQSQVRNMIYYMMQVLKKAGAGHIIIKNRNNVSVDCTQFDCDYYDFLKGNTNNYQGEYMKNYSWAEMTVGLLWNRSS